MIRFILLSSFCSLLILQKVNAQRIVDVQTEEYVATFIHPSVILSELAPELSELNPSQVYYVDVKLSEALSAFWNDYRNGAELSDEILYQRKQEFKALASELANEVASSKKTHQFGQKDAFLHGTHGHAHRQGRAACNNLNFDNCDWGGWTMSQGLVDNTVFGYVNDTITTSWTMGLSSSNLDQHFIVSGSSMDAVTGAFPEVFPDGGNCSAVIGDSLDDGGKAASCWQSVLIDSTNTSFNFSYAVVVEDPGHSVEAQPFFRIIMTDTAGAVIPGGVFEVVAGDGNPAWNASGQYDYIPWTTVHVPLQAYLGQMVNITYVIGDCDLGAHAAYAYLDVGCSTLTVLASDSLVCAGAPVVLTAPAGGVSYLWSTGDSTQTISVSSIGTYSVDVTSFQGLPVNYSITLSETGSAFPISITAQDHCQGDTSFFSSDLLVGAAQSAVWDFDGDSISDYAGLSSSSFLYPDTGTYQVTLAAVDTSGCLAYDTVYVSVLESPDIPIISYTTGVLSTSGTGQFVWMLDTVPVYTSPDTSYTPISSGVYSVMVTASNGCTASSDTLTVIFADVSESMVDPFRIFPNPSSGTFNLQGLPDGMNAIVEFFDTQGRLIKQLKLRNGVVDRLEIASGVYHLRIPELSNVPVRFVIE